LLRKDPKQTRDPFKFLRDIQNDVAEETRSKVGNRIAVWSEHYIIWIDMIKPILKATSREEQLNSMLMARLLELNNELLWILSNIIYHGAYHQVIRELRFVLDSMMQAYYLDTEHPDVDILCKLEIIKEIEKWAYGARLIERLPLQHKDRIGQLYSSLSKYSHSSYKEMEISIRRGKVGFRVTPSFDEELFSLCESLTHQVMDAIYLAVLNQFPYLCESLSSDEILIANLKNFGCQLALEYLKSASSM